MLTDLPYDILIYSLCPFLDCDSKIYLSRIFNERGDFIQKIDDSHSKLAKDLLLFRLKRLAKCLLPIVYRPMYLKGTKRFWAIIMAFRAIVKPEYIMLLMYNLNYRKAILQKTAEFSSDDAYQSLHYAPKKWIKFIQNTAMRVRRVVDSNSFIDISEMA